MVGPEETTLSTKVRDASLPYLSTTVNFGENEPAVVGVPVTLPVALLMVSPAGRPVADQVNGAFPPVRAGVSEYGVPTDACWGGTGEMAGLDVVNGIGFRPVEPNCNVKSAGV